MEILSFLLPFHLSPFQIDLLPSIFFLVIWGLFFFTIFRVYRTAKSENWEHNWYGGNKNNHAKKLDAEHGSVMEISEAVATSSEKLADIMPGMILIIGLLGTFLGLGLALDKASSILTGASALSDMDASMANLMQMLEGLGTKFKTSTWGLLAFILLKVILSKNGYEERRLRWCIEKVKSELDIVRDQKLQEERNNNNKLMECMQSIAMQFEQTMLKNQSASQDQLKQLTQHTQDTIKTIQLSHEEQLKQLNVNHEDNIRVLTSQTNLIQELNENSQKNHTRSLEQIGNFLLSFEQSSEERVVMLEKKFGILIQQSDKLLQLIRSQHQETKDLLDENVTQSIETRNAMIKFIQKNEETVLKLGKAAEGMSQAASTMGTSASQLQNVIDSFRKNMEEVISLMKKDLNSTISNMNTSFSQNMTKMSDNLKSSIGDMSTSFKKNMSEMSQGLGAATQDISKAVTSLSTSVDKTMNEVTKTIGESMELQTKAQKVFTQSTNTLNEYIEEMTGLVNKLSGDITGGLKAVSESNRQVIGLGKQIKLSSEELTQTVTNAFNELSENLSSINSLQPTLENLAQGIVLQKETLQKIESQNSQRHFSKNSQPTHKGKKGNSAITKHFFGLNGAENEG